MASFITAYKYLYSVIKYEKKCIRIEPDISNDELFAMLDGIDSGGESNVGSILSDSNTEFIIDKPINKMVDDVHDILVPEAKFHVASKLT